MDETTKVLIGTISGFVVAFFAEPVKMYFTNRSKKQGLRLALYKEMMGNITILANYLTGEIESEGNIDFNSFYASLFRFEAFNYAITDEVGIFFQIQESMEIREFYIILQSIVSEKNIEKQKVLLVHLRRALSESIKNNVLDKKMLIKVNKDIKEDFDEIFEKIKTYR